MDEDDDDEVNGADEYNGVLCSVILAKSDGTTSAAECSGNLGKCKDGYEDGVIGIITTAVEL